MKTAETILHYLDKIKGLLSTIDSFLDTALEYMTEGKKWLEKMLDYVEQWLNSLAEKVGKTNENRHLNEEHMFV